jgi:hypothetical protein
MNVCNERTCDTKFNGRLLEVSYEGLPENTSLENVAMGNVQILLHKTGFIIERENGNQILIPKTKIKTLSIQQKFLFFGILGCWIVDEPQRDENGRIVETFTVKHISIKFTDDNNTEWTILIESEPTLLNNS